MIRELPSLYLPTIKTLHRIAERHELRRPAGHPSNDNSQGAA